MSRQQLARIAIRASFEARHKAATPTADPICVYDLAESIGTKVLFVGGPSFSGMYAKDNDYLLVPSERPPGRRAFTCAHELAHWWFNHGTRVEELDFDRSDNDVPEEILANIFAAYLLMPRSAVTDSFARRRIACQDASELDIYSVACQLGVGYETLINHMRWSLNLIDHARMKDLIALPPKEIRRNVLGRSSAMHMVLADTNWRSVAIDLQVGETAVVPAGIRSTGTSIIRIGSCAHGDVIEAVQPGLTQLVLPDSPWAVMARVSRFQFNGFARFRHLEETENEDE